MTSYEQIYAFDNLYSAHRAAARGKRGTNEVVRFECNLARNLWALHDELEAKTYRIAPYQTFIVHDPKRREVQALSFRDRVVQHSLCDNVLAPYIEPRLIYDCAACRMGKGAGFAIERLKGFMRSFWRQHGTNGWFLKCDVRKYFESIDHMVLKRKLLRFPDDDMRAFLYQVLDSYHAGTGKGLPLGNQSSQWFALWYLDPLDRLVKEQLRVKYYTRYMDDLVLLHQDKGFLRECLARMKNLAHDGLHLEFNEKTQIFPVSQGVDYLGWHFYLTETGKVVQRLRTSNKRRLKRRIRKLQDQYAAGEIEADEAFRILEGYQGHLEQGDTYALREQLLGNLVLKRTSGNACGFSWTGHDIPSFPSRHPAPSEFCAL